MTAMLAARLLCGLAVPALQSTEAAARAQPSTYERQQKKRIGAWTVGLAADQLARGWYECCAATKTVQIGPFQSTACFRRASPTF